MTDHSALVRLTGSFACLLVLAGCGTSSTTANGVAAPAPAPSPVPTTVAAPEDAEVVFDELVAFVEDTRDFSFEQPPTLRVVGPGDAAFEAPYDEEWLRVDESRYRALGILGPDFESDPCLADGSGCDAVGYYDPVTNEMVVSSTENGWGPAVRATIVHELTHAVQEQRGDLVRLDEIWWQDFEAADVLDALIEGEATLMEDLYLDSLPARARWLRWDEEVAIAGPYLSEPIPYLDYVGYYPYDEGARAVTAAYHVGGWDAVDTLFADPPATTEALEYPDAGVSVDEAPIEMPELSPDGFELFETGRWGKNDFDGYLLDALPAHEPTGWGDDWFEVRWDGTTAVSIHVLRGDDAAATDRFAEALLRHCRDARLGDGFALLQNDPDLAFVASVDPAVTDRFRSQLVEQGFTSAGSC